MLFKNFIFLTYLIIIFPKFFQSLRIIMCDIPSTVMLGDSVELSCSYDLGEDRLYSVKWYKNDVEFYRYVPKDWPPGQFLPLKGAKVDLLRSTRNSVYLKQVDLNSAGVYRCEVSAEAPSFNTAELEKEMKVFVLPSEGPRISGKTNYHQVGDIILLNCSSLKSKPAAVLKWFIDNEEVGSEFETLYSTTLHQDGLETSSLSLKFKTTPNHFKKGNIKIKCTANISKMYKMSNEAVVYSKVAKQQSSLLHISQTLNHGSSKAALINIFFSWHYWLVIITYNIHNHQKTWSQC